MTVGDAFSGCNGSSAFSSRGAIDAMKVVILNRKPPMGFYVSLKRKPRLYVSLAAVCRAHSAT
jgi:hypothetical protein